MRCPDFRRRRATWHHYFDLNLWGFQKGGEVLDRLTEYYLNLTLWLTLRLVKLEVNGQLLCWLSRSLSVRGVLPEGYRVPGITAAGLVREVAGQGVLDDLVWPLEGTPSAPEELLLGAVVKESVATLTGGDVEGLGELISQGIR
ncbi:hypothetical protein AB0N89_40030 [Amycolatopsis sp. NPDC089917]|uniref:hypothetical protein n=1 Tax=Amycolatopsis sp. NPDC089917 TaxID=3155187 RepID=UPI003423DB1D